MENVITNGILPVAGTHANLNELHPIDAQAINLLLKWAADTPGAHITFYRSAEGAWSYSAMVTGKERKAV